jgi:DNA-binding beta-propeller fold protein YncE
MNVKRRLATAILVSLCLAGNSRPHRESRAVTSSDAAPVSDERKPVPEDIPAARMIADPNPAFNGIAVDPTNGVVVMSDPNRKSLLVYDRTLNSAGPTSVALRQIIGPETYIGMVAAVVADPQRQQIYTVNNDIEDTVVVMPYGATGNAKPARVFSVPHQAWGLALSHASDEIAVSVEIQNAVVFYRSDVNGVEAPLRIIRGPATGLADPHGIYWDEAHHEIGVANHGNFRGVARNTGGGCAATTVADESSETGEFRPPSVAIFSANAKDDAKPLRTIQGPRTLLDWPMGVADDRAHDSIAVANNGDDSILIFDRMRGGDVAPVRAIRGNRTGINRPMGIAVDEKNNEIWVTNYGDHTALVFDSAASGNVAPRRIIRSAPIGTPTPGFGNPMALAYDGKRQQILVPN